jgi:hypothetical protein
MARMHEFSGSYIPLPETPEERDMTGDPRRPILERYPNAETYVAAITAAAQQLVEEALMLERGYRAYHSGRGGLVPAAS